MSKLTRIFTKTFFFCGQPGCWQKEKEIGKGWVKFLRSHSNAQEKNEGENKIVIQLQIS